MMQLFATLALVAAASAGPHYSQDFSDVSGFDGCKDADGACELVPSETPIKAHMDVDNLAITEGDGKDFVLQYEVKYPTGITCQGSYLKLISSAETGDVSPSSPYVFMFGPDKCGYDTKKIHFIYQIKHGDEFKEVWADVKGDDLEGKLFNDEKTNLLTLIVKDSGDWIVKLDNEEFATGKLCDDETSVEGHYCKEPETIKDPESTKPDDWVDETQIDDPEDVKPDDWVEEEKIIDPEAEQPEDWDEEMDGEWEAPEIDNPDYKGAWSAKKIDNPEYKGEWVQADMANPAYIAELASAQTLLDEISSIAVDLTVNHEGMTFDNVAVYYSADAVADAAADAEATFVPKEKADQEALDAKKAEEEAKKAEEEAAAAEAAEAEDDADEATEEATEDEEATHDKADL